MTNGGPKIVIEGTFEFSPGDARTFWPLGAERDGAHAFWLCAELVGAGSPRKAVRFRITLEEIARMTEDTPARVARAWRSS